MKIFTRSLVYICAAMLIAGIHSCSDDKDKGPGSIILAPSEGEINAPGSGLVDYRIDIETNANSLQAACLEEWVDVRAMGDHLLVTIEKNMAKTTREGLITVTAGTKEIELPVYQDRRRATMINTYEMYQWSIECMSRCGRYLWTTDGAVYDWVEKTEYTCPLFWVNAIDQNGVCYGALNSAQRAAFWQVGDQQEDVTVIEPDLWSVCVDVTLDGAVLGYETYKPGYNQAWIYENGRKTVLDQPEDWSVYARKMSDDQSIVIGDVEVTSLWKNGEFWRPVIDDQELYQWVNMPYELINGQLVDWWNWKSCLKYGAISRNGKYIGATYYETGYDEESYAKVDTYTVPVLIDVQTGQMKRFDDYISGEFGEHTIEYLFDDGSMIMDGYTLIDPAGQTRSFYEWINDEYGVELTEGFPYFISDDKEAITVFVSVGGVAYFTYYIVREY